MKSHPRRQTPATPQLLAKLARDVGETPIPHATERQDAATDRETPQISPPAPASIIESPAIVPPPLPDSADLSADRNREALLRETEKQYLSRLQRWRRE